MHCALFYKTINTVIHNPLLSGLLISALSAIALGGAYFSQYALGFLPCSLCLYQRMPHALLIALGLLAAYLAYKGRIKPAAFVIFISGLAALGGAAIAAYHVGVEQHWWVSFLEACAADFSSDNLLAKIERTAAVRCDVVPFTLLGVSMAGYNALLSAGMFFYAVVASILITRRANGL